MSFGVIIFILGVIYSIASAIAENSKKKGGKKQGAPKSTFERARDEYQKARRQIEEARREIDSALNNQPEIKREVKRVQEVKSVKEARQMAGEVKQKVKETRSERQARPDRIEQKVAERVAKTLSDPHLSERQKMNRLNAITEGDLTQQEMHLQFDKDTLLQGIIMSELLAKPKAKR